MTVMNRPAPPLERLMRRVQKAPSGCWEWQGKRMAFGHGQIFMPGRGVQLTHRVSWELHRGPIADGLHVRHDCDNPRCVNPDHLRLGTNYDNKMDSVRRGRHRFPILPGIKNPSAKLTEDDVRSIRSDTRGPGEIGRLYGIRSDYVCQIRAGKTWRHVQ